MKSHIIEIMDNNIEYNILPYQFFLLSLWGLWHPSTWSKSSKFLFKLFFGAVLSLHILINVEVSIHCIQTINTPYFQVMDMFFFCTVTAGLYKTWQIMKNRQFIISFLKNYFNEEWMIAKDENEAEILNKFDLKIKLNYKNGQISN